MSQSTITFLILAVTVAVFVWDHLPVGVVAFGVALSLWATGVLDLGQALAGFVPAAVARLLAAGAIVLSGVLSMEETYRAIAWTTVILVGGMTSLSTAMVETGAAGQLADRLVTGSSACRCWRSSASSPCSSSR